MSPHAPPPVLVRTHHLDAASVAAAESPGVVQAVFRRDAATIDGRVFARELWLALFHAPGAGGPGRQLGIARGFVWLAPHRGRAAWWVPGAADDAALDAWWPGWRDFATAGYDPATRRLAITDADARRLGLPTWMLVRTLLRDHVASPRARRRR